MAVWDDILNLYWTLTSSELKMFLVLISVVLVLFCICFYQFFWSLVLYLLLVSVLFSWFGICFNFVLVLALDLFLFLWCDNRDTCYSSGSHCWTDGSSLVWTSFIHFCSLNWSLLKIYQLNMSWSLVRNIQFLL